MDTIQSLVEQGSFCIDRSLNKYMVDVIKIGGRFYSDKPPLLSVIGAGVYWPLYHGLGISFAENPPLLYYILTVLLVGFPLAAGLYLFGRCLELAGFSPATVVVAVFLTGAGTLFLPYAVTFNNHIPAATAIIAALYCLLRAEGEAGKSALWSAAAGFFGALAFNFDLAPGGAALLCFAPVALARTKSARNLFAYGAGAAPLMVLYLALNYAVAGDLIPLYLHPEFYRYEGSVLLSHDALKRPYAASVPSQFFHYYFGYRGIFSYSPFLIFGLCEALRVAFKGGRFRAYAIAALVVLLLSAGAYAVQVAGMAGASYGMRWLLPVTPLFAFFAAQAWEQMRSRAGRALFYAAAAFSIAVAAIGVPRPWSSNIRSPITFLDNIAYFWQTLWPPAKPPVYWIVEHTSVEKGYAYFEIGRWHMNHGYYRAAIADLERARRLEPDRLLTDYYLGICYDAAGRPDLAVEAYERLLKRQPNNTGALNNYALSLRKLGLRAEAFLAYKRSLAVDPNKVFTLRGIGDLCIELGNLDEAAKYWEKALEIEPRQPDLRIKLAELYRRKGRREKALEHLRALERLGTKSEKLRKRIEKLRQELGRKPPGPPPQEPEGGEAP